MKSYPQARRAPLALAIPSSSRMAPYASTTESAEILVTFVHDEGTQLTTFLNESRSRPRPDNLSPGRTKRWLCRILNEDHAHPGKCRERKILRSAQASQISH
jgi:hypothetical protein